jgi:hypothetical protein
MNEDGWRVGKPVENVIVRNVYTKAGHGGVVFGSDVSGGIRNVYVHDCYFDGTEIGIRLKTMRGRGGYVENIWVNNVGMRNIVQSPVHMTMFYTASTLQPASKVPSEVKNLNFHNIYCEGTDRPFYIVGLPEKKIRDISFENFCVTGAKKGAICTDATNLKVNGIYMSLADSTACYLKDASDIGFQNVTLSGGAKKLFNSGAEKTSGLNVKNVNTTITLQN